jgi:hypothetical protein
MDQLSWTGSAGTVLLPVIQIAILALALSLLGKLLFVLAGLDEPRLPGPDGTTTGRSPGFLASIAIRMSFFAALAAVLLILAAGAVMPTPVEAGILGAMAVRCWRWRRPSSCRSASAAASGFTASSSIRPWG